MLATCTCLHCKNPIEFEAGDFIKSSEDSFVIYGQPISCPHCGEETNLCLSKARSGDPPPPPAPLAPAPPAVRPWVTYGSWIGDVLFGFIRLAALIMGVVSIFDLLETGNVLWFIALILSGIMLGLGEIGYLLSRIKFPRIQ